MKKLPFSTKMRITAAAGAIPGTTLAALGDFFSPAGGFLIPLGVGLLAATAVVCLFLMGTSLPKRVTAGDEGMQGWWDGPRHKQLGIWVLSAIAVSGLAFGLVSHSRAAQGGFLGSNIAAVSEAQQQLGILRESLAVQTRTAEATESIDAKVKREVSEDPRKELANMQQPWSERGFLDALEREDLESVELYLAGGMRNSNVDLPFLLIRNRRYAAVDLLEEFGVSARKDDCVTMLQQYSWMFGYNRGNDNQAASLHLDWEEADIDPEAVRTYKVLCSAYPNVVRMWDKTEGIPCMNMAGYSPAFCENLYSELQ